MITLEEKAYLTAFTKQEKKEAAINFLKYLGYNPNTRNNIHIYFNVGSVRFDFWPTTNKLHITLEGIKGIKGFYTVESIIKQLHKYAPLNL